MKFGNLLSECLEKYKISNNQFAKKSDLSTSYINKLINNPELVPLEKSFKKLALGLYKIGATEEELTKFIKIVAADDRFKKLIDERNKKNYYDIKFDSYEMYLIAEINNVIDSYVMPKIDSKGILETLFLENRIAIGKDNQIIFLSDIGDSLPLLDLEWLLKQKKFHVYYGNELMMNNTPFPNVLSEEDKKVIYEIVNAYLSTKYEDKREEVIKEKTNLLKKVIYKEDSD
ncbi:hypothetical protein [Staphylococcus chromogenes]|uniref:hypothetical protein n=1 Tax=Staphylococcus chromogenes TaxID=46126 RepID=UPI000E6903E5|nr:hypothetical protein [Staphylococcus chromogenes]MDU0450672.1 hypothetical protein [Staphylococcus chromogenes]RIM16816.1 hypothetical protein BU672_01790 [Staphylococcus chromogenes]